MRLFVSFLFGVLVSFAAQAQYPARPVTFIVPWPPGGTTDLSMRAIALIAEKYLGQAASRLPRNSEVQDHFGDVLARRGRLPDAVEAWTRALDGDGSDIDRGEIQKKINDARGKIRK